MTGTQTLQRKRIEKLVGQERRKVNETINIMYSNIQGFTKKKENLIHIMEELDCDVCLLTETMTKLVKIRNCRCFNPNKSVGQNVCIIVRNEIMDKTIIKMYEPNEMINLMGIRVEMLNSGIRIYTAHLKQQSVSSREDIAAQFEEIHKQFQDASKCNEGMIMILDANVHVGKKVVKGGVEEQDWGGETFMKMIYEENLVLLNALDLCSGVITRVDPRNGNGSTLDLAVCNQFMASNRG